jgi:sugar phosphate isomerase/epimerase
MSHPLAVQLYTLRGALAEGRDSVLRRVAEIGFGAVEPFDPTDDPAGFRKSADDLGLVVSSTHAMAVLGESPGEVFEAAHTLGTDLVIVPAGFADEDFRSPAGIAGVGERLNNLSQYAESQGIHLGYHNHWWEIEPTFDGRHAIELLADELEPEVFLEVDTYWATVGGADVPALLGRLGGRVRALHVKDGPAVRDQPMVVAGTGAMDFPPIIAAAPDAWRIVEFDECATDIFEAIAGSHAYLTAYAAGEAAQGSARERQ